MILCPVVLNSSDEPKPGSNPGVFDPDASDLRIRLILQAHNARFEPNSGPFLARYTGRRRPSPFANNSEETPFDKIIPDSG